MGLLKSAGLRIIDEPDKADYVIVNTCGFIKPAKEESINAIFEAAQLKESGKMQKLVVVGCLSERYNKELSEQIPEVDRFFGVNENKKVLDFISSRYDEEALKHYLPGERELLTPGHSVFLKISEGCSHTCSFCAIPMIRGKHISRPVEDIIKEAQGLADRGVKELSVIAQDTTYYGKDLYGKRILAELLEKLSGVSGIEWIRLMYAYPRSFPKGVLDVIASNKKICNYIDIPLQHISDNILKSMRRGLNGSQIKELVAEIREKIPGTAIRSAFITGYPGEGEKEFGELYDFISEYKLDRVGVFIYSHEDDTKAFELKDEVPDDVKEERRDILMTKQNEISLELNRAKIGNNIKVIVDERDEGAYICRSEHDAPEVDNAVILHTDKELNPGDFIEVEVTDAEEYDLHAEIRDE